MHRLLATQLNVGACKPHTRGRYVAARLEGIKRDLPRGAPPMTVDVAQFVELTTQTKNRLRLRTGARERWQSNWG